MEIPLQRMMNNKIRQIRDFMSQAGIDAWIIYDFGGCDPTGGKLLGSMTPHSRQYVIIISQEDPIILIKHCIEVHDLSKAGYGFLHVLDYRTQAEFMQLISEWASHYTCIAVNYTKANPEIDVLPAGRFTLLQTALPKARWVTGENLMQIVHSVLTEEQLASHERAAKKCDQIMEEAFNYISENIDKVSERDVASRIVASLEGEGLVTVDEPMVAVGPNTANPHHIPGDTVIHRNQPVMIDLWAKWEIYADITKMAYTGSQIPPGIQRAWEAVIQARDRAADALKPGITGSIPDMIAREVLTEAGYGDAILHRTGHNIDTDVHGKGANLDSFEIPETRILLPGLIVSVEPGVYLLGRFGIRSEIDVAITSDGHRVTTHTQREIIKI